MVAGMVASSPLWGYLADTRGRRKVLIATLLLDFLCAIAGSFAHTFWLFVVFRFFNGFFICGPSAVVYVYLGEFHTAEHRTKAIMWACIFISIGIISLPGLAWLVIPLKWNFDTPWFPYSSWRLFVALCGVPSLVTCIIMALFLPESPKFYQAIGQDEEALKALRYIYTVNKGNSPDQYPVKAIMSDPSQEDVEGDVGTSRSSGVFISIWNQTAPLFQAPHLRNTVIACLIQLGHVCQVQSQTQVLVEHSQHNLFNRLAVFSSSHPNQTATVCEILSILKKEGDDILLPPENLTSHVTVLTNRSSQPDSNVTSSCVVNIDPIVFQNTLVIGFTSAMAYLLVSQVVNHVNKNKIVAFALAASGLTILGMYFVHTTAEVLPLSCVYVALPGMCVQCAQWYRHRHIPYTSQVQTMNQISYEGKHRPESIWPSNSFFLAMAVCLSLMMGRLGTGASSLMLGALLEFNCALVIFILVGVVIGCGILALLLPSPEKKVTSL
uniref:(California timema) hypothetical protein n=1 Tax=Timema californicum TaxID=61474 RepID=A0A7R9J2N2_TIMCA|nr:unnamed protein product [Timema californicum]